MDRGAWHATVFRVAKSWTRLKRLSTFARMHALLLCRICGGQGCGDEIEVDRAGFGSDDKREDIGWGESVCGWVI